MFRVKIKKLLSFFILCIYQVALMGYGFVFLFSFSPLFILFMGVTM
jgi:hypothetical protein